MDPIKPAELDYGFVTSGPCAVRILVTPLPRMAELEKRNDWLANRNDELVARNNDMHERNQRQAKTISSVQDGLRAIPGGSDRPLETRVRELVTDFLVARDRNVELTKELNDTFDKLANYDSDARKFGIPVDTTGTPAVRVARLSQNLITAYHANRALAKQAEANLDSVERGQLLAEIEKLRKENRKLKDYADTDGIYRKSITASHHILTEFGVEDCGDVPHRLRELISKVRNVVKG